MGLKFIWIAFFILSFAARADDINSKSSDKEVYFFQEEPISKPESQLPILVIPNEASRDIDAQDLVQRVKGLLSTEQNKNIQINIIENAHFHFKRKSNERALSSVNTTKWDDLHTAKESLFAYPEFSFTRLDAKDSANGGEASAVSHQNMGVLAGFTRTLSEQSQLIFFLGGSFQSYLSPSNAVFANSSNLYLRAGGSYQWQADEFFDLTGRIGLKQLAYLDSVGNTATINNVTHPFVGAELTLKMKPVTKLDLRAGVFSEFLNNSVVGSTKGKSAVNFGLNLSYDFLLTRFPVQIKTYYQRYSLESSTTTQTNNEIGINLGFIFPL